MSETRLKSLSPARHRLLELFRDVQFGRVEMLVLEKGEPLFGPATRIVRTITFGGDVGAKRDPGSDESCLKRQVTELFAHFDRIETGTIDRIDLKAGLPCFMTVDEPLRLDGSMKSTPPAGRGRQS
jgi:hypothetical protein